MTNGHSCPECGRPLPQDAREQVCPVCALQGLLKFVTASSQNGEPRLAEADPASTPALQPNVRFGDYELLELLARGGMGVVYKARQISLNRTVALKMIQAGVLATPAEVKRFHTEAEAIAQLHHPNIVAVHEIGEQEGQHYFSMDYVAGRTLAEIVRDGPLPAARAAAYVRTVATAVHYAHQQGILHRDLKPANVIIDEQDQPRITDFGLAKRFFGTRDQGPGTADLTLTGQVLGSPNYLPPEQAEPKRGMLGPPSDVYALGAILYHLLTGRPPFQAESLTTLLRQVIETDPVAPRTLNPGIPRDLETICLKCLEKEPHRRYGAAQALAEDLERFVKREPVLARPVAAPGRAWRWCRRRPVLAGLVSALALILVLGMSGVSWQWRRAERERDVALRLAYAGDMVLAQRSLEEGDLKRALALLDRYRPRAETGSREPKPEADLRGWEWRYLWGLCRSDDYSALARSSNRYECLALAPDGKVLAARGSRGVTELRDLATGRHTGSLTNWSWPQVMAFSPDGRFFISANQQADGRPAVCFWDVRTTQLARELLQPSEVTSLAISPDGKRLATLHATRDPRFRLWELPSGRLLLEHATAESYFGMAPVTLFSPDGMMLALGENTGQIRLLDLATQALRPMPESVRGQGVYALAFSADGQFLASSYGWTDTAVYIWEVASGRRIARLDGHRAFVTTLAFAPDGQTLYSGSADQSIGIWDVRRQAQIGRRQGHTGWVTGLALCPDGQALISCSQDGSIRRWDLRAKPRPFAEFTLPESIGLYGGAFTADSGHLITVSRTNLVAVWEVGATNHPERIPALGANNQSVALSPDGRLLAVGGWDGALKVWDLKNQRMVKQWQPHDGKPVFGLRFLDGGKSLLSAGMAPGLLTDVKRWKVGSWERLSFGAMDLEGLLGLTQSPNQQFLASIYNTKPLKVWDSASGRLEATLASPGSPRGEGGLTPAFSPDRRFLAAALRSDARVWEVGSWRRVAAAKELAGGIQCVAFSPDSKRLATGSTGRWPSDPVVHIWDYSVERELLSLHSPDLWTGFVEFSPDGNTLLAVSWYGLAKLWHAPSWAEIEAEGESGGESERR